MIASADTIFCVLDSEFASAGEIHFRRFVRRTLASKWLISADFVIGEPEAVHDVFAFTVFPYHKEFPDALQDINSAIPRDLKRIKVLTDEMVTYLRDPMRFHLCFLAEKGRHGHQSVESARTAISRAIDWVKTLDAGGLDAAEAKRERYLRALRIVEHEARARKFKFENFSNICLFSVLLATIMAWIVRHGEASIIGVMPDRDKMTGAFGGLFRELVEINHSGFCRLIGLDEAHQVLMPSASVIDGADLFYDPLVRIPDYVAGAISRFDYRAKWLMSDKPKHKDLVERFLSDNSNLVTIQMMETPLNFGAASIWLTTGQSQRPPVYQSELIEYAVAKARGFRRMPRCSHRQMLLNHAGEGSRFSQMLDWLMKGAAAGNPGSIALMGAPSFSGGVSV